VHFGGAEPAAYREGLQVFAAAFAAPAKFRAEAVRQRLEAARKLSGVLRLTSIRD
jgi:hypothetical protein